MSRKSGFKCIFTKSLYCAMDLIILAKGFLLVRFNDLKPHFLSVIYNSDFQDEAVIFSNKILSCAFSLFKVCLWRDFLIHLEFQK